MGRHTLALSDDWSTCTRCDLKLDHGVCNCCGAGSKHICRFCMDGDDREGKDWGWAIGDNEGCDEHLQTDDIMFPPEYPKCEHVIAEERLRESGW